MPGLTGVEVCRRIRAEPHVLYRYLMLLTAYGDSGQIVEGLEAGADDYLVKPFHGDELRARIRAGERILALQSELVAARDQARAEATCDALTGLLNRGALLKRLDATVAGAVEGQAPTSVVLIDIDHFKRINDSLGHDAGDLVLREVSQRLRGAVRPGDAVGRYGGEEFLIVLPGCDLASACRVADRLRVAIEEQPIVTPDPAELHVTASLGVAAHAGDMSTARLITNADQALYRAKGLGRNRVEAEPVLALPTRGG
jgi:two-component system, cell cycle response regulator